MKTITAKWFECRVRYGQMQETGLLKKVTEQYVVDALSFTEAEERIIEGVTPPCIRGGLEIVGIKPASYRDVCFSEDAQADRWYKVKVVFFTLDEKSGKVKRTPYPFLVQAASLDAAVQNVTTAMKDTLGDYEKATVTETKILDVFEHRTQE